MKIIRPEQPIIKEKPKEEKLIIKPERDLGILDDKPETIEDLMCNTLQDNLTTVTFSITLTKRQYDFYIKKGGLSWLKKVLTGQVGLRKRKKRCSKK